MYLPQGYRPVYTVSKAEHIDLSLQRLLHIDSVHQMDLTVAVKTVFEEEGELVAACRYFGEAVRNFFQAAGQ